MEVVEKVSSEEDIKQIEFKFDFPSGSFVIFVSPDLIPYWTFKSCTNQTLSVMSLATEVHLHRTLYVNCNKSGNKSLADSYLSEDRIELTFQKMKNPKYRYV